MNSVNTLDTTGEESQSSETLLKKNDTVVLQPSIFSPFRNLLCGISTRLDASRTSAFGMNISFKVGDDPAIVGKNRDRFFSVVGIREVNLAIPGQVHDNRVSVIDKPGRYEDHDALITNRVGLLLSVTIADCVPILLFDRSKNIIAAVHSGWRGCKLKILGKVLKMMTNSEGSDPHDIYAYIGPSAGTCCYEVGKEVADNFDGRYLQSNSKGKSHLDLRGINRDILLDHGVPGDHIEVSRYCTICRSELFHSYRRDNKASGRMMAVIGLKEVQI